MVARLKLAVPIVQMLVFAAGLMVFVFLWLALIGLLAQDACLDRGGAPSGPGFGCRFADGNSVAGFGLVSPMASAFAAALAGWPVYFAAGRLIRRIGSSQ